MTTLEEVIHTLDVINMDHEMIQGAFLRIDYQATDMIAHAAQWKKYLQDDERKLNDYPGHWIEAARQIMMIRKQLNTPRVSF